MSRNNSKLDALGSLIAQLLEEDAACQLLKSRWPLSYPIRSTPLEALKPLDFEPFVSTKPSSEYLEEALEVTNVLLTFKDS